MSKVSVIIPVYNTEQYMAQTLESLINQTFSDWECIMVDDCSTDDTMSVLKHYALSDNRFRITSTPANTGSPKIPIDIGVGESSGEFICIMGCDDYVDSTTIESLLRRQEETSADVVCLRMVGFNDVDGAEMFSIPDYDFDFSQVISGRQAVMMTIAGWRIGANFALLKRDIVTARKSYRRDDIVHMNADEFDTRDMILMADKVAFVDTCYHYRQHPKSITKKVSHKLFEGLITDRMLVELFEERFGCDAPETLVVKSCAVSAQRHSYIVYARLRKQLSDDSRKLSLELIDSQWRYIVGMSRVGLSFKNRVFLSMPEFINRFIGSSIALLKGQRS